VLTDKSADKLTDRLRLLLQQGAPDVVSIKIRLGATSDAARLKKLVDAVSSKLANPEYVGISGTIHGTVKASGVSALTKIDGVESIDVERTVPVTELMDPEAPASA
jgi:hypothetical protein